MFVLPAQHNLSIAFGGKRKISNVIFSLAYTPNYFYFRFMS
jgi:hypothetical protein